MENIKEAIDYYNSRKDEKITDEIGMLLEKVVELTKVKYTKNGCFESDMYFVYVAWFPSQHVAIDNKSGTTRLYWIFEEKDIPRIK